MADPPVVVVADPDPAERARVRKVLESVVAPLQVLEASDRPELDAHLVSCMPDLIISEILLEGGSGLDLLRVLAERHGTTSPPVILVTELARETDRYWALRNGAQAFVGKPYEDSRLRDRISKALAGGPRQSPDTT